MIELLKEIAASVKEIEYVVKYPDENIFFNQAFYDLEFQIERFYKVMKSNEFYDTEDLHRLNYRLVNVIPEETETWWKRTLLKKYCKKIGTTPNELLEEDFNKYDELYDAAQEAAREKNNRTFFSERRKWTESEQVRVFKSVQTDTVNAMTVFIDKFLLNSQELDKNHQQTIDSNLSAGENKNIQAGQIIEAGGDVHIYNQEINIGSQNISNAFQIIYDKVKTRPEDPNISNEEVIDTIEYIEKEIQVDDEPNEAKLIRWLSFLADMAPDIYDVVITTINNPVLGIREVIRKIVNKFNDEYAVR